MRREGGREVQTVCTRVKPGDGAVKGAWHHCSKRARGRVWAKGRSRVRRAKPCAQGEAACAGRSCVRWAAGGHGRTVLAMTKPITVRRKGYESSQCAHVNLARSCWANWCALFLAAHMASPLCPLPCRCRDTALCLLASPLLLLLELLLLLLLELLLRLRFFPSRGFRSSPGTTLEPPNIPTGDMAAPSRALSPSSLGGDSSGLAPAVKRALV